MSSVTDISILTTDLPNNCKKITLNYLSVTFGCGATRSENMTFFELSGVSGASNCVAKICKKDDNICQIRLDFNTFVIAQPTTALVSGN